ncbi:unnamed protein product, partial [Phaeothamnion confervicola]
MPLLSLFQRRRPWRQTANAPFLPHFPPCMFDHAARSPPFPSAVSFLLFIFPLFLLSAQNFYLTGRFEKRTPRDAFRQLLGFAAFLICAFVAVDIFSGSLPPGLLLGPGLRLSLAVADWPGDLRVLWDGMRMQPSVGGKAVTKPLALPIKRVTHPPFDGSTDPWFTIILAPTEVAAAAAAAVPRWARSDVWWLTETPPADAELEPLPLLVLGPKSLRVPLWVPPDRGGRRLERRGARGAMGYSTILLGGGAGSGGGASGLQVVERFIAMLCWRDAGGGSGGSSAGGNDGGGAGGNESDGGNDLPMVCTKQSVRQGLDAALSAGLMAAADQSLALFQMDGGPDGGAIGGSDLIARAVIGTSFFAAGMQAYLIETAVRAVAQTTALLRECVFSWGLLPYATTLALMAGRRGWRQLAWTVPADLLKLPIYALSSAAALAVAATSAFYVSAWLDKEFAALPFVSGSGYDQVVFFREREAAAVAAATAAEVRASAAAHAAAGAAAETPVFASIMAEARGLAKTTAEAQKTAMDAAAAAGVPRWMLAADAVVANGRQWLLENGVLLAASAIPGTDGVDGTDGSGGADGTGGAEWLYLSPRVVFRVVLLVAAAAVGARRGAKARLEELLREREERDGGDGDETDLANPAANRPAGTVRSPVEAAAYEAYANEVVARRRKAAAPGGAAVAGAAGPNAAAAAAVAAAAQAAAAVGARQFRPQDARAVVGQQLEVRINPVTGEVTMEKVLPSSGGNGSSCGDGGGGGDCSGGDCGGGGGGGGGGSTDDHGLGSYGAEAAPLRPPRWLGGSRAGAASAAGAEELCADPVGSGGGDPAGAWIGSLPWELRMALWSASAATLRRLIALKHAGGPCATATLRQGIGSLPPEVFAVSATAVGLAFPGDGCLARPLPDAAGGALEIVVVEASEAGVCWTSLPF